MEIIGVQHTEENLRPVIEYIDAKYPDLEKIMLELVPGYEEFSNIMSMPFFGDLATYYKEKNIEVIPGDRKYWELFGLSEYQVINMAKMDPVKTKYCLSVLRWTRSSKDERKRTKDKNIDINEVFREEKPDVTVVGGFHGEYLKKHNPDVYFSFFVNKDFSNYFRYPGIFMAADMAHRI